MQFVGGLVLSCAIVMPIATARGTLLGTNLFPADNPWNQNISQAPVATNSAAIMSSIKPEWSLVKAYIFVPQRLSHR
jgi:hypothetical protein